MVPKTRKTSKVNPTLITFMVPFAQENHYDASFLERESKTLKYIFFLTHIKIFVAHNLLKMLPIFFNILII